MVNSDVAKGGRGYINGHHALRARQPAAPMAAPKCPGGHLKRLHLGKLSDTPRRCKFWDLPPGAVFKKALGILKMCVLLGAKSLSYTPDRQ